MGKDKRMCRYDKVRISIFYAHFNTLLICKASTFYRLISHCRCLQATVFVSDPLAEANGNDWACCN